MVSNEATFTTAAEPPIVETTGTPLRTATSAQLLGRVDPRGSATDYHFEYGTQGPCDANPCATTAATSAGNGQLTKFVARQITGLEPSTTYDYRLVADNGVPGSPIDGGNQTVTTRESDEPLSHGHFPGPPGSDRAYELVSVPDSGGNPLFSTQGFSDDGDRAIYQLLGGAPISDSGSIFGIYTADRPAGVHPHSGWETSLITPPRAELSSSSWYSTGGSTDLSNFTSTNGFGAATGEVPAIWRLVPAGQPTKLFEATPPRDFDDHYLAVSADGHRVVAQFKDGALDPAYPAASATTNLYDISAGGDPQLVSLLPGNIVPACGSFRYNGATIPDYAPSSAHSHWISADGNHVYFPSRGNDCSSEPQLYVRNLVASETKLISGPALSGPSCGATLIKATPDAAFLWTQTRLDTDDTEAGAGCSGSNDGDVYRYDTSTSAIDCITCTGSGPDANVTVDKRLSSSTIAVAENGSRVYFATTTRLLPEAPPSGTDQAYRVNVASGNLAYVGPIGDGLIGSSAGDAGLTPDGTQLFFRASIPGINTVGGTNNGATQQIYRYADTDRSLVCISCPQDGAAPSAGIVGGISANANNRTPLADDGTFAFATPVPLASKDQNTPRAGEEPLQGTDVYEWRDGQPLLITDGLTDWPAVDVGLNQVPRVLGITPTARDLFFAGPTQYTPDALDGFTRLYDARIGGGIEFSPVPAPCPLEVCQGTPRGAPEEAQPGTGAFSGPGNVAHLPARQGCPKNSHAVRRRGKVHCKKRNGKHRRPSRAQRTNYYRRAEQ